MSAMGVELGWPFRRGHLLHSPCRFDYAGFHLSQIVLRQCRSLFLIYFSIFPSNPLNHHRIMLISSPPLIFALASYRRVSSG